MQRDKFGRPENSVNYGIDKFTPVEWDETTTEGTIYLRGDYDETCLIQRIDVDEGKIGWAFGSWTKRASLEYGNDRLVRRGG